ncbi:MAG: cupin domain-containing protein [Herpetosiphonaceae bacterium]|nr:cupin domain-containing protein [Herpetosiphonaceae bacterium]
MPISTANAEHYTWGQSCDGWFLVKSPELTIIQERVPPGGFEVRHYHERAWQFFYVLSGQATLEVARQIYLLGPQEGLEIAPGMPHQLRNQASIDLLFTVTSRPNSHGDRVTAE